MSLPDQEPDALPAEIQPHSGLLLQGMQPAFQNARTGELHLAQLKAGIPASVYGFAGLPEEWIVERDIAGNPVALHPDIIAGYWRDARFFSLQQLSRMPLDD